MTLIVNGQSTLTSITSIICMVDETRLDKMGVDELGVDELGVDELGVTT